MSPTTQSSAYNEKFVGDRYERLSQGVDVLSQDPAIRDASFPFDEDGLRALVTEIIAHRLLDHLSEANANLVTAMVLLDFHGGADKIAARIRHVFAVPDEVPDYDTLAVVSGLARVLALVVTTDAWIPATTGDWS